MSVLILPSRFKSQPQGAVELAPSYRDALFFSMLRSISDPDIARRNGLFPVADLAPTQGIRPWGRTLVFNGLGQNLKTTSGLGAPTSFTVLAWVRPATTGWITSPRIAETEFSVGFMLGANGDSTQYEFVTAANFDTCVGGTLVLGRRDFVVGTFASNMRSLYVNGDLVATAAASGINPSYGYLALGIGANPGNPANNCWKGDIDTVGVFPRAFSSAEILALYQEPWQIFKVPARRLWAVSADGTTHDLIGAGQISSAEAFGTSALSAGITSSGVATAEALGSAGITAGISAAGIATAEAIGSAGIVAGVSAAGIETVEAEGSPQFAAGIAGSSIASTEALGDATLTVGIQAAGITGIEAVGAPEVGGVAPANVVGAGAIASSGASGSPAVSAIVEGSGVSSAEGLGQPAVGIPAASVTGAGQITTGEAFGSPTAALAVLASGIDSVETTGNATVVVAIDGAGQIAPAEAFGVPLVGEASPQQITGAGGIASIEAFGSANIQPFVPYTGTGFQPGSGHRPIRRQNRQPVLATVPHTHSIGTVGIESAERLGYPTLTWRGRTRRIREEAFLLGRAA